ncbi:hypothetical protein ABZV93_21300 [Actinopolymorpha sp. NPDC004070]|uniref:hypothetical protein n=1 Tax=Actinopolymorpha sp. NPDC004070 TaxID=3154548 RepID=UPI0033B4E612
MTGAEVADVAGEDVSVSGTNEASRPEAYAVIGVLTQMWPEMGRGGTPSRRAYARGREASVLRDLPGRATYRARVYQA